jgi:hypothetical protein
MSAIHSKNFVGVARAVCRHQVQGVAGAGSNYLLRHWAVSLRATMVSIDRPPRL